MFCKNCGSEINDTARFCMRCGFDRTEGVQSQREIVEDNIIRYQVKPKFNILYRLLINLRKAIIYTFYIFLFTYELCFTYPIIYLLTIGAMLLIYVVVKMIIENMQCNGSEYNFYATKIEYKYGFLNKVEKELKYKYIREVVMHQTILERFCGMGAIEIFTNASSGGGIYITWVEDVQEQYRTIQQIIAEGISKD